MGPSLMCWLARVDGRGARCHTRGAMGPLGPPNGLQGAPLQIAMIEARGVYVCLAHAYRRKVAKKSLH